MAVKWVRTFDGGQYECVREDGLPVRIILKDSGGKFANMRRYSVSVAGRKIGDRRILRDAKALGLEG